jgi:hypothetical protein
MTTKPLRLVAAALVAGSLLVATGSSAQDRRARPRADVTEHTFTDADEVYGDRASAEGLPIRVRLPGENESLIRYRTHFRDALLKSVEIL